MLYFLADLYETKVYGAHIAYPTCLRATFLHRCLVAVIVAGTIGRTRRPVFTVARISLPTTGLSLQAGIVVLAVLLIRAGARLTL